MKTGLTAILLVLTIRALGIAAPAIEIPMADMFDDETDIMVLQRPMFELKSSFSGMDALLEAPQRGASKLPLMNDFFREAAHRIDFSNNTPAKAVSDGDLSIDQPFRFVLPKMKDVQSWKASLINQNGVAIKSWTGEQTVPEELVWDGQQEGWMRIHAGLSYSLVLEVVALDKTSSRIPTGNFVFPSFAYSVAGGQRWQFAVSEVGQNQMTDLLARVRNKASSYYLKVHVFGSQPALVAAQIEALTTHVTRDLKLKKNEWQIDKTVAADQDPEIVVDVIKEKR